MEKLSEQWSIGSTDSSWITLMLKSQNQSSSQFLVTKKLAHSCLASFPVADLKSTSR